MHNVDNHGYYLGTINKIYPEVCVNSVQYGKLSV